MGKYSIEAYAQEGEDLVLKEIFSYFENRKIHNGGFFVDVGAFHPERFSNTNLFYKRNWTGINIDATPNSMILFNQLRLNDINIECAISDREEVLEYYLFDEPALNSFDKKLSIKRDNDVNDGNIVDIQMLKTRTLEEILINNLSPNIEIDFLSIDVEGYDLGVLKSNNWTKYSPKVILIEILGMDINKIKKDPIYQYLINKNYTFVSKTIRTHFFLRNDIFNKRFSSE